MPATSPGATMPAPVKSLTLALCAHAQLLSSRDGAGVVELIGWDVDKDLADRVRLGWSGPQALAFFKAHQADLRPGRVLYIGRGPLSARDGYFSGRAHSCTLAPLPPSWRKHAEQAGADAGPGGTFTNPKTLEHTCQPSTS